MVGLSTVSVCCMGPGGVLLLSWVWGARSWVSGAGAPACLWQSGAARVYVWLWLRGCGSCVPVAVAAVCLFAVAPEWFWLFVAASV